MTDHQERDIAKGKGTDSLSSAGTILEEIHPGTAGTYGESDADAVNVEGM